MKEFVTRAAEVEAEDAGEDMIYPFMVDGRECKAGQPTSGQLGVFTAMISDVNGWQTQAAGIVNFFLGLLDPQSKSHLATRLMDRKDPFEIEQVRDIMIYLMEQWSANPTDEPSGSTGSPSRGGRTSKRTSPKVAATS